MRSIIDNLQYELRGTYLLVSEIITDNRMAWLSDWVMLELSWNESVERKAEINYTGITFHKDV
jgi:hypothetical protein